MKLFIAEDDPIIQEEIRNLLKCQPDIEIIGETDNANKLANSLMTLQPDIVFLDLQLIGGESTEALHPIINELEIEIVIITGLLDRAGEVFALLKPPIHYIHKPFTEQDIQKAIFRIRKKMLEKQRSTSCTTSPSKEKAISLRNEKGGFTHIPVSTIAFIENLPNKSKVHFTEKGSATYNTPMYMIDKQICELDITELYRSHESYIINLLLLKETYPDGNGLDVTFHGCPALARVSRRNREEFFRLTGIRYSMRCKTGNLNG